MLLPDGVSGGMLGRTSDRSGSMRTAGSRVHRLRAGRANEAHPYSPAWPVISHCGDPPERVFDDSRNAHVWLAVQRPAVSA